MWRAQDPARSAGSRKIGARSATIKSRALGALKVASCARSARWECAREAGRFFFERQVVSLFWYRLWYLASSPSSVNLVRHQLPEKFRFICVYLCPTTDFVRVWHGRSSNFAIKSVVFLKKPVFLQKGIVAHILVHILMYYNYHYSF